MKNYWIKQNSVAYQLAAGLVLATMLGSTMSPLTLHAEETSGEASAEPTAEIVEPTPPPEEEPEPEAEVSVPEDSTVGEVVIDTGDATAAYESESAINTNEVDTEVVADEEKSEEGSETEPEKILLEPVEPEMILIELTDEDSTTVTNANEATTTTNATTTADTGGNVGASGGSVTIKTGDAVAYADVVNVVNTNITNSQGLIDFVNDVLGYEDFDLRDEFSVAFGNDTAVSTPSCTLDSCQDDNVDFTVTNTNDATINNNITVVANTGSNAAAGSDAKITTGDAYASASVINVANTNITDSNYLLLVFNNFDNYAGDIVLPNSSFFDDLQNSGGGVNNLLVENTNSAEVTNNVSVTADSGNNTASGESSFINTGDSTATGQVTNLINTNVTGGTAFSILIRVNGDWSGDIYGLPDGMSWARTNDGVRIFTTGTNDGNRTTSADIVRNTNRATINNNVQVYALTGDNVAVGDDAEINTGNAYAEASVMNTVNTNIVGSNWANLIFNIYGSWSGNLAFGQPDLWLGVRASSEDSPIMPGSMVTYTYTVFNHGDVPARNVFLENTVDTGLLKFSAPDTFTKQNGRDYSGWQLGNIEPGGTKEMSYTAKVGNAVPEFSESVIPLVAQVTSEQPDANPEDNQDQVDIYTGRVIVERNGRSGTFDAKIDLRKTADKEVATPGDIVNYTIKFFNRGGVLYDAVLTDVLEDEEGNVISEQMWPLGDMDTHERITIEYSTAFAKDMKLGKYINYAQVVGRHASNKPKFQEPYYSAFATHELTLGDEPAGEVLGAATSNCSRYLTTYMRYGIDNSEAEVRRLQVFLNEYNSADLDVNGVFDLATEVKVRAFQKDYATDILDPWGLTQDSGYVYYTTQKKINELVCDNQVSFPLTSTQEQEVATFRQRYGFAGQRREESAPSAIPDSVPTAAIEQKNKLFTWAE